MSEDLRPITPQEAVDLHLEAMRNDSAEWTQYSHKSHLRAFVEWCREEAGLDNMNELDGRDLYHFRVWRREGGYSNGQDKEIAPKTIHTVLTTVRAFLKFCGEIEAVEEDLYMKVPLPDLSPGEEVSDSKMVPERVTPILDYLEQYEYASRDHVIFLLLWCTGARTGGIRALDLRDCDLDCQKPGLEFVHRPDTETPLKNDEGSERYNRITERTANALQAYIDGPRNDITDDYGREPLVTTTFGRVSPNCVRKTTYKWTRPCIIGKECPHEGKEPQTCEFNCYDHASKCPSTRSPHDVRKARVTKYRDEGIHRGIVSDRLDASEPILDKHYDRASKREKADRRWKELQR